MKISIGTLCSYKPFFIILASVREKVHCMCMICLNIKGFDNLMANFEMINADTLQSVSKYMMNNCMCDVAENGYWDKDCYPESYKIGNDTSLPLLPENTDNTIMLTLVQLEKITENEFFSTSNGWLIIWNKKWLIRTTGFTFLLKTNLSSNKNQL